MTEPTFKKATNTAAGSSQIYGAPDIKYAFDVLDGSHPTDRIQISNIEGRDIYTVYAFFVRETATAGIYEAVRPDTGAITYTDTDFATIMNTVMAALPAPSSTQPIGIVYISGSHLDCSTTSITVDKPCIIDGMGSAIVRKMNDFVGTNRSVFNIASSDVTLRNFTIDNVYQTGNPAARPIVCQPSSGSLKNIFIENVRIKNAYNPIYFHASTGTAHLIEHAIIRNCWIDNASNTQSGGPGILLGLGCKDVTVLNCQIIEPGDLGIDVFATEEFIKIHGNLIQKTTNTGGGGIQVSKYGSTTSVAGNTKNISIRDNAISGACTGPAIRVYGAAEKVIIANNTVIGAASDGIVVREKTISSTDYWAKEVIIQGNIIKDLTVGNGIWVKCSTTDVEFSAINISGNYVHDVAANGINLNSGMKNVIVNNNMIYRYGKDQAADRTGIFLRFTTNSTVLGNKIFGLTGSSTPTAGTNYTSIREESTTDNNIIIGNGVNQPISTLGTATIVARNDGYKTEANGTVSGNATTLTVTHGLGYTPTLKEIFVTPTTTWGSTTKFWVSSPTSTQFTINLSPTPGQSVTFAWQVSRSY